MDYTGVLILNYNTYDATIQCIESIERYNTALIKYIVVDNGSTNADVILKLDGYFKSRFLDGYKMFNENDKIEDLPDLSFIIGSSNTGYAQGNNLGLKFIYNDKAIDNVLVINNDVIFVADIITNLIHIKSRLTDAAILSPLLFKKDGISIDYNCARLEHSSWELILTYIFAYKNIFNYINYKTNKRYILKEKPDLLSCEHVEIELPSGSCMLCSKIFLQNIGGFDPHTFLYFEENILYRKIKKYNLKNYCIPSLKCIHLGAISTTDAPSGAILKFSLDSADYYLRHYVHLTKIQMIFWNLAKLSTMFKVKILGLVRK